jgi:MFS family permease
LKVVISVSSTYRPIAALLFSIMLVVMGQGIINTIVPLGAKIHNYGAFEISLLGSAYFIGMLLGAFANPAAIRHAGHVRAFTASIALSTIAALTYTFASDIWLWIFLRAVGGFAIAGLYATAEGWLQAKSTNASRGRILALYSIAQYIAWAGGNTLLQFAAPTDFVLFAAAALCFCSGILPVTVVEQDAPERPTSQGLPIVWLLRTCPLGVIGVFLVGLNNGPMWSLMPIYGVNIGLSSPEIGTLMVMMTLGSAALQLPIGRISDTFDRRKVALVLMLTTAVVEVVLWLFSAGLSLTAIYVLGFTLGAFVSTQYFIFVAITNDVTGAARAVGIAAVMLFVYCLGAIIGPTTATALTVWLGPSALHLHDAIIHVSIAAVLVVEIAMSRRRAHLAQSDILINRAG